METIKFDIRKLKHDVAPAIGGLETAIQALLSNNTIDRRKGEKLAIICLKRIKDTFFNMEREILRQRNLGNPAMIH